MTGPELAALLQLDPNTRIACPPLEWSALPTGAEMTALSYSCYHDSMRNRKERMTVTVDLDLVQAANDAVASGRSDSLSAWVSAAMSERASKERRLASLAAAIADYEAEFGEITQEEIAEQARADRETAIVVRGRRRPSGVRPPRRPGSTQG